MSYLQGLGSEVHYFSGDVSVAEELRLVVESVESELGDIDGVIHTAGIIDDSYFELIEEITVPGSLSVFGPKVEGIKNLYGIFKDRPVDFVWITSSLSSVLGGLGYSSYASSNLFMDHFVSSHSEELKNWRCIGLSGMVFGEAEIDRESGYKREALTPVEICGLFDWSISLSGLPVVLETIEDLCYRLEKTYSQVKGEGISDVPAMQERSSRGELEHAYVAAATATEAKLVLMVGSLLGISDIGIEDNFFEMGGDSLKAMVLIKRLKKEFNINIPLKDFFQKQNIKELAEYIDNI
ncbi:SDR family NAD(P)-dependent oxidoreductase, partial [Mucilaginibacter angelicae]